MTNKKYNFKKEIKFETPEFNKDRKSKLLKLLNEAYRAPEYYRQKVSHNLYQAMKPYSAEEVGSRKEASSHKEIKKLHKELIEKYGDGYSYNTLVKFYQDGRNNR